MKMYINPHIFVLLFSHYSALGCLLYVLLMDGYRQCAMLYLLCKVIAKITKQKIIYQWVSYLLNVVATCKSDGNCDCQLKLFH